MPEIISKIQDINIIDLLKIVKLEWKFITIFVIFFSLFSLLFILPSKDYYKSDALLVTTQESNGPSIPSSLSSLSSFAGISVGSGADDADLAVAKINSRMLFQKIVEDEYILAGIVAAIGYKNGKLIYDEDIYNSKEGKWVTSPPSIDSAFKIFRKNILWVRKQGDTKYINISVRHMSPYFAYELLTRIIDILNSDSRSNDDLKSQAAIEYYFTILAESSLQEVRQTIAKLAENEIKIQMMSKTNKNYLVEYLDVPYIPMTPDNLSKGTVFVLSCLFWLFTAFIIVVSKYFLITAKQNN